MRGVFKEVGYRFRECSGRFLHLVWFSLVAASECPSNDGERLKSLLSWWKDLTFQQFIALLTAANVAMYVGAWAGVGALQRLFAKSTMNAQTARVSRRDLLLSIVILGINVGVGIPGWWLWKHGYIVLV